VRTGAASGKDERKQRADGRRGDQQIRTDRARFPEVCGHGGEQRRGRQASRPVEQLFAEAVEQQRAQQQGEQSGQAGCRLADAQQQVRARNQPVQQRWLVEKDDIVEMRCDPVAADDHLAGDLRVLSVIRLVEQRRATQICTVGDRDQAESTGGESSRV
jgi:hypothetical protein